MGGGIVISNVMTCECGGTPQPDDFSARGHRTNIAPSSDICQASSVHQCSLREFQSSKLRNSEANLKIEQVTKTSRRLTGRNSRSTGALRVFHSLFALVQRSEEGWGLRDCLLTDATTRMTKIMTCGPRTASWTAVYGTISNHFIRTREWNSNPETFTLDNAVYQIWFATVCSILVECLDSMVKSKESSAGLFSTGSTKICEFNLSFIVDCKYFSKFTIYSHASIAVATPWWCCLSPYIFKLKLLFTPADVHWMLAVWSGLFQQADNQIDVLLGSSFVLPPRGSVTRRCGIVKDEF